MPSNKAAWLVSKKGPLLHVKSAPYTSPPADMITIKTGAVAINPIDWLVQDKGDIMYTWVDYPSILGFDIAGEVVEVGKNVTRFQAGDRVLGWSRGIQKDVNSPAQGAFQEYVLLEQHLTSHIPGTLSYESASVIPLGLSTAAVALFQKEQLGLQFPTAPAAASTGKTLIVWGGSTSVGCNAIQLGVAAGYEVFTTSSSANFDLVKKLGASQAFDYRSSTVVQDIIRAMKGKTAAGALSIGRGAAEACMEILAQSQGNKFVSMATFPVPTQEMKFLVFPRTALYMASWIISYKLKGLIKGVQSSFFVASSAANNEFGKAIYADFLPKALKEGTFVAAPEPHVIGKGVEGIQDALDFQKKGVSAKKVVVSF